MRQQMPGRKRQTVEIVDKGAGRVGDDGPRGITPGKPGNSCKGLIGCNGLRKIAGGQLGLIADDAVKGRRCLQTLPVKGGDMGAENSGCACRQNFFNSTGKGKISGNGGRARAPDDQPGSEAAAARCSSASKLMAHAGQSMIRTACPSFSSTAPVMASDTGGQRVPQAPCSCVQRPSRMNFLLSSAGGFTKQNIHVAVLNAETSGTASSCPLLRG